MAIYSKESLETLRQRIDLTEVISSYVTMQRSGSSYKGLCPFHEEKNPSFMIHKGDSHYHCFGCGAHGDAISFLMSHVKMTFVESLEYLSEKFQVPLDRIEEEEKGPNKKRLKQALEKASEFYRFFLLHSEEGSKALEYLYSREIDVSFITRFEIGYAPKQGDMLYKLLRDQGFYDEELWLAGLLRQGGRKDFFQERITFPIKDKLGSTIGFSARKFKEETFGGKYVNTSETPLFKKSNTLFAFSYSRHKIAKERRALIVEGQIDALRLIFSGFDFTVAGQGTAFGEGHLRELLTLGINRVYLALDGDTAGLEAAVKIGDLFQNKGVEVTFVSLPPGSDPDSFIRKNGKEAFALLMEKGIDYLTFYYRYLSKNRDMSSPSQKNELIEIMASRIRQWERPVVVHESLRKLAEMAGIPHGMLGIEVPLMAQPIRFKSLLPSIVDPDRIIEMDLLRWLLVIPDSSSRAVRLIEKNISKQTFKIPSCARLFEVYSSLKAEEKVSLMSIATHLERQDEQELLNEILEKKVNIQRAEEGVFLTIKQILSRNWMEKRGDIQSEIQKKEVLGEDPLSLIKELDSLNKRPPVVLVE